MKTQLQKENVEVKLGVEATPELIKKEKPDVLIVSVGAEYTVPAEVIKDKANIMMPEEVTIGKKPVGNKVWWWAAAPSAAIWRYIWLRLRKRMSPCALVRIWS